MHVLVFTLYVSATKPRTKIMAHGGSCGALVNFVQHPVDSTLVWAVVIT